MIENILTALALATIAEGTLMIFNALLFLILLTVLFYLLVGGCLWFHNRYKITFKIRKRELDNDWKRLNHDNNSLALDEEDLQRILEESDKDNQSNIMIQQLPGIFQRRIQKR